MTIDTDALMFAGWDQGTVASLTANGLYYECTLWINRAQYRVEALCKVMLPDGSTSVVFHNFLDVGAQEQIEDTNGYPFDQPKIIAVGTTFVAHWLMADDTPVDSPRNWALFRATMDMTAFDASSSGWTARGSLAVHEEYALYDVAPLLGSSTDFMLVRSITDGSTLRVERYNDFGVIDTEWQEDLTVDHFGRVLAIYGHEADGDVIVTYEQAEGEAEGGQLWSWHLDVDTGTAAADDVQTFTAFSYVDHEGSPLATMGAYYVQVKHCRVAANVIAVVAEALLVGLAAAGAPHKFIRHLAYRRIVSADATRNGNEQWVANLSMCSAPWAYEQGASDTGGPLPNVYCVVSYKSIYPTSDWEQSYIYAVNLDHAHWNVADSGLVRPRPIATFASVGIPDGRHSGWHPETGSDVGGGGASNNGGPIKRCNHVSFVAGPPPYGPLMKTRTVAVGIWAQMGTVGIDPAVVDELTPQITVEDDATVTLFSELQPENAGLSLFRVYMEDPWTIFRDADLPTQPIDNFSNPNPRSMFQSLPVARGMATLGGTPFWYDGERTGELGFPSGPEIMEITPGTSDNITSNGDLTVSSTYYYYIVPTRRDRAGHVHRGRPSRVCQVVMDSNDNQNTIRVRTITLSTWDNRVLYDDASDISFEVFRTVGDGAVFYRLFGARQIFGTGIGSRMRPRDTPLNDPLEFRGSITFVDGLADTELTNQGKAPFALGPGGFVEVTPQVVPALMCPAVWQGSLWGADMLDPSLLWYSDQILPDIGGAFYRAPEFNGVNTFRIDGLGEVTALQPMGDALWVFTVSTIAVIRGTPNDGTGQGADLSLEVIHTGIGCVEPRSVCLGPTGILFQSQKGMTWLERGGGLDYVSAGASVEDDIREAGNVRATTLMEQHNVIKVVCNGRPVTTWTTTWSFSQGGDATGDWTITLTGDFAEIGQIASFTAVALSTDAQIGAGLAADIAPLVADRTLEGVIASVTSNATNLIVVWAPDVVPSYTDASPGGTSIDGVDTSELSARPRVLHLDYLQGRWSRGELPDVHLTVARFNEVVGATTWNGAEGQQCHVVLQQGDLRLERATTDANAYADTNAVGGASPVRMDIQLAPLHLAGTAGCKRVRRVYVQMSKPQASEVQADLHFYSTGNYDRPDDFDEEITVDTETPSGFMLCPRRQKVQALGIRIYEPENQPTTENVVIHSITLLAGVKKGLAKWGDAQRGST